MKLNKQAQQRQEAHHRYVAESREFYIAMGRVTGRPPREVTVLSNFGNTTKRF